MKYCNMRDIHPNTISSHPCIVIFEMVLLSLYFSVNLALFLQSRWSMVSKIINLFLKRRGSIYGKLPKTYNLILHPGISIRRSVSLLK